MKASRSGSAIKFSGTGLNDWMAEEMLKRMSPDEARAKTGGPALEAVERAIKRRAESEVSPP